MAKSTKDKNKLLSSDKKSLNHFGIVLRVYPDEKQSLLIDKTIGSARLIYNMYLHERQEFYKNNNETLSKFTYNTNHLVPMKKTEALSFLKEVDKFALESSLDAVDDAYRRFFNKQNGFPKFKSKRSARQSYTTKFTNNNIEMKKGWIKLPKLKSLKFNESNKNYKNIKKVLNQKASIKKATVYKKSGRYYVTLLCEELIEIVEPLKIEAVDLERVIGIDLGLVDFATISNGISCEKLENPKYFTKSEKKLAKLQKTLSKKKKNSKNFTKAKHKVSKLHETIANQRKDFSHQLSRKLVNENQVIVVEDLNIKGMVKNKFLAKSISDAGWGQFIRFLDYKMKNEGKHLISIDRWFASSKMCSTCSEKNIMLSLNKRTWTCSFCGTYLDRDENASMNIRAEGLRLLGISE